MNRRSLLQLAGGAAIAWPLPALAQKGADLPLVAMLVPGNAELARQRVEVVRAGIKEAGLVEGTHYSFAMRFAGGDFSRLRGLAKELGSSPPARPCARSMKSCRTRRWCSRRLRPTRSRPGLLGAIRIRAATRPAM